MNTFSSYTNPIERNIMNESIPHLNIEVLENGCIRLENESMGDSYVVDLHPVHLRHIAEKTGLIRKMSASEADTMRTVGELKRRLLALQDRIDHLGNYLALHSDHKHADLSYETNYATATADICEAYCADFLPGDKAEAEENPTQTQNNPVGSDTQPAGLFELVA